MELNFKLDYRTEVVFKERIIQLDDVFQEEALWIVDKKVLSRFSPPPAGCRATPARRC